MFFVRVTDIFIYNVLLMTACNCSPPFYEFRICFFFTARSPVFGHFSTTLLGLPTIRAFRVQDKMFELFTDVQDSHTEVYSTFLASTGWLSFNLDLISGLLIIFCCFVPVVFSESEYITILQITRSSR